MGDKYLRRLLVIGATSLVRRAKYKPDTADPRLVALLARKPVRVATVAMANKMARIAWALMTRGQVYQAHHAPMLRSEEHTSELQSLMRTSYAVFCLKKK